MPQPLGPADSDLKAKIVELLDDNRIMTVATLRPDGWPQATMVGYVHEDLRVYFVVARTSQKLANIKGEARVSIAMGHLSTSIEKARRDRISGLSMAARAAEVTEFNEIERLNTLVERRYPEQQIFAPRHTSAALIRATPTVISVIDFSMRSGEPELVYVNQEMTVHRSNAPT